MDRQSITQLTGRWATRLLIPTVLGAFGAGGTVALWHSNHPTTAQAQELIADSINKHDHGNTEGIPLEQRVRPPVIGMAAAIKECSDQSAALNKTVDRMDRIMLTQMRWFVSGAAADAEPDPRKKAQSARVAVSEFLRLVRVEHVDVDEAARQVLETSPY